MTISFKKFAEFVSSPTDLTDGQINELFGAFKNNEKLEKLKAAKEKLKQRVPGKEVGKEVTGKEVVVSASDKKKFAAKQWNPEMSTEE